MSTDNTSAPRDFGRFEDYLYRSVEANPKKCAVVFGNEMWTYADLWKRSHAKAIDLRRDYYAKHRADIAGRLIPFRAQAGMEFLTTYFGIHMAGAVAMPLEKDMPDDLFASYEEIAMSNTVPEGTADVLFTTGTTGKSKGVMISHRTIVANTENLVEAQGFHGKLTFVITGPLNHIGSLSKVFPTLYTGGTLIITDGMKDMNALFDAMESAEGNVATFLVPASIRMLLTFAQERVTALADKIEFIETGAAPMSEDDMRRLCQALPKSRLFNTYASTETGIIATFNYNEGECLVGCLGHTMRHSRLTLTEDGLITCQGPTLMSGYLGDEALTATVLRDGTLYTSDIATIDEKGRLRLQGRADDVINIGGYKVAPTEVEDAAMTMPDVADCICIAVPHPVMGTALKLLVVTKDGHLDRRTLATHLRKRLEQHMVPLLYKEVEKINRTYNGKLNRKSYRE